jgi:hypothetical protein
MTNDLQSHAPGMKHQVDDFVFAKVGYNRLRRRFLKKEK